MNCVKVKTENLSPVRLKGLAEIDRKCSRIW